MNDIFWLFEASVELLRSFFQKSCEKLRVHYQRALGGIIFIQRNGLMWKHAPSDYCLPKAFYSRWKRWSRMVSTAE